MNATGVGNFLGDEKPETPELGAVRAKMQVSAIETVRSTYSVQHKVKMGAICSNVGENKAFTDATPSGECWMNIADGFPAASFFKPGKNYYVTFTEAPK